MTNGEDTFRKTIREGQLAERVVHRQRNDRVAHYPGGRQGRMLRIPATELHIYAAGQPYAFKYPPRIARACIYICVCVCVCVFACVIRATCECYQNTKLHEIRVYVTGHDKRDCLSVFIARGQNFSSSHRKMTGVYRGDAMVAGAL